MSPTIFQGTAKDAVSLFPANINVSALLSLSGIGSEKTMVTIMADPNTDKNTHHIEAIGTFGKMTFVPLKIFQIFIIQKLVDWQFYLLLRL